MKVLLLLFLVAGAWWPASSDELERLLRNAKDESAAIDSLLNSIGVDDLKKDDTNESPFPPDSKNMQDDPSFDDGESGEKPRQRFASPAKLMGVVTKGITKVRKGLKGKLDSMLKKFQKTINKVTDKARDGWKTFKTLNPKQSGKKLMKSVLKEVYETAKEEGLAYLAAAVEDWIKGKLHDELCQCFVKKNKGEDESKLTPRERKRLLKKRKVRKCRCCIKPPGFKRACVKMVAKLKTRSFDVSLLFNGTEFLKTDLVVPPEEPPRSKCSAPKVAELRRDVCGQMPGGFHFISICISPGDVELDTEEDEGDDEESRRRIKRKSNDGITGFGACFQIKIGKLGLSFEKCIQYDYAKKMLSFVTDTPPPE